MRVRQTFGPENQGTNCLLTERQEPRQGKSPFTGTFSGYWLKIFKLLRSSESRGCFMVISTVPKITPSTRAWECLSQPGCRAAGFLQWGLACGKSEGAVLLLLCLKWLSAPCGNSLQLNLCCKCYSQKSSVMYLFCAEVWIINMVIFPLLVLRNTICHMPLLASAVLQWMIIMCNYIGFCFVGKLGHYWTILHNCFFCSQKEHWKMP